MAVNTLPEYTPAEERCSSAPNHSGLPVASYVNHVAKIVSLWWLKLIPQPDSEPAGDLHHKPWKLAVATDGPALAAVAVGRTAPIQVLVDTAPLPVRAESALAKASDAEVATASTAASGKQVATPKRAKKTKTASRRVPRRDPYWYGAPSWREVEYQRGGYGRGGFTPNFW